ncbi:homeobox protein BEL1 homolog, partial [Momordica charantia]|uniref:Homeobox protein BEL1 homolog n=1 Tax=Momordica charantia TaxID=3673 RepID=A0A6J1E2Q7_MOMCH
MGGQKSEDMVVVSSAGGFYYSEMNSNSNNNSGFGFGFETEPTGGGEFHDQNMMVVGPWGPTAAAADDNRFQLVDDAENDSSALRCVFPCEGNERPSQGLSLSLSSSNPSSIGLQSFELRPQNQSSTAAMFQLRNSRFLAPAQNLLCEFCSLGETITNNNNNNSSSPSKHNNNNTSIKQWELEHGSSSSTKLSLHSLDFVELQKRKSKLFSMLEEVERRYRQYCEQMKGVVAAFE